MERATRGAAPASHLSVSRRHKSKSTLVVVALAALAATCAPATPPMVTAPGNAEPAPVAVAQPQSKDAITITGNHAVTTQELRAVLVDALGGDTPPFDPEVVDRAVLVLSVYYYDHGFANARVGAASTDAKTGALSFAVTSEGPKFTLSDVQVDGELLGTAEENLAHVHARTGMTFSRKMLAEDRNALQEIYEDAGYAFVEIEPMPQIDTEHATLAIRFSVKLGPKARFGRVVVVDKAGTPVTDAHVSRAIVVAPEQAFTDRGLLDSRRHLLLLGYHVDIATKRGVAEDVVDVTFELSGPAVP